MTYEKLPHDIIFIRRRRWETRLLAIVFGLVIFGLLLQCQAFNDLYRSYGKRIPQGKLFLFVLLNAIYIGYAFSMQSTLINWFYKRFGKLTDEDFMDVLEGIYSARFPAPKILPVWVAIIAKCGPVILASIVPSIVFWLLGWNIMQLGAILLFFVY